MKKGYRTGILIIIFLVLAIGATYISSKYFFHNFKKKKFTVVVDNISSYGYTLDKRDTKIMKEKFNELKKVVKAKDIDYKKYSELISQLYVIDLYTIENKVNKYDVPCLEYIYSDQVEKFKSMIKWEFYSKIEDNSDKNRTQKLPVVKFIEENPSIYDPRKVISSGRDEIYKMIESKINIFYNK